MGWAVALCGSPSLPVIGDLEGVSIFAGVTTDQETQLWGHHQATRHTRSTRCFIVNVTEMFIRSLFPDVYMLMLRNLIKMNWLFHLCLKARCSRRQKHLSAGLGFHGTAVAPAVTGQLHVTSRAVRRLGNQETFQLWLVSPEGRGLWFVPTPPASRPVNPAMGLS